MGLDEDIGREISAVAKGFEKTAAAIDRATDVLEDNVANRWSRIVPRSLLWFTMPLVFLWSVGVPIERAAQLAVAPWLAVLSMGLLVSVALASGTRVWIAAMKAANDNNGERGKAIEDLRDLRKQAREMRELAKGPGAAPPH